MSVNLPHIFIGCQRLCIVEENIVLAFIESGGDSSTRLAVSLNQAYTVSNCYGICDTYLMVLFRLQGRVDMMRP